MRCSGPAKRSDCGGRSLSLGDDTGPISEKAQSTLQRATDHRGAAQHRKASCYRKDFVLLSSLLMTSSSRSYVTFLAKLTSNPGANVRRRSQSRGGTASP